MADNRIVLSQAPGYSWRDTQWRDDFEWKLPRGHYHINSPTSGREDAKHYLKHKWNELNPEWLIVRLKIEDDNRTNEKRNFDFYYCW